MNPHRPPRLVVKTLIVTLGMVSALLAVVFIVIFASVRRQVRDTVIMNLESTQRLFAALEARRQRELRLQAVTLAESPTLKAALETYLAEARTSDENTRTQLLNTINRELHRVSEQIESDAIVLADLRQNTIAAAGPLAARWPLGRGVALVPASSDVENFDGVVRIGASTFRVVTVPLTVVGNEPIGTLYLATSLDRQYAESLDVLSRTRIAIISDGLLLASTLSEPAARAFESAAASRQEPTIDLSGEAYAFRRLVQIGDTSIYALGSIDQSASGRIREATRSLALIGAGAAALALIGSFLLARMLSKPIGQLSESLARMARTHDVEGRLAATGSSLEIDTLTETFNDLMASVVAAEAQTEAAYTGAIRALAAALDARDPYTAGHSERVSVLSVAIGRELGLPQADLQILRLGALLHDIGKIGVPDDVLRKPAGLTEAEYESIKQHPVLGARILRLVPFLAPHLPIVELHHERPDGRGYPHGLRGDDIPLPARIVHVADAYDAMTSARAYRSARPSGEALRELWRCSGTEFHAEIVGALATALPGVTSDRGDLALESVSG
jgi:putative nucleotidyltransferase with HDIG domain